MSIVLKIYYILFVAYKLTTERVLKNENGAKETSEYLVMGVLVIWSLFIVTLISYAVGFALTRLFFIGFGFFFLILYYGIKNFVNKRKMFTKSIRISEYKTISRFKWLVSILTIFGPIIIVWIYLFYKINQG